MIVISRRVIDLTYVYFIAAVKNKKKQAVLSHESALQTTYSLKGESIMRTFLEYSCKITFSLHVWTFDALQLLWAKIVLF